MLARTPTHHSQGHIVNLSSAGSCTGTFEATKTIDGDLQHWSSRSAPGSTVHRPVGHLYTLVVVP